MRHFAVLGYIEDNNLKRDPKVFHVTDAQIGFMEYTLDGNFTSNNDLANLLSARLQKNFEVVKVFEIDKNITDLSIKVEELPPNLNHKDL